MSIPSRRGANDPGVQSAPKTALAATPRRVQARLGPLTLSCKSSDVDLPLRLNLAGWMEIRACRRDSQGPDLLFFETRSGTRPRNMNTLVIQLSLFFLGQLIRWLLDLKTGGK